jgi:hypothetical protein
MGNQEGVYNSQEEKDNYEATAEFHSMFKAVDCSNIKLIRYKKSWW